MEKKYVKLVDAGSTFHDSSSDTTFVGKVPKLVSLTERIRAGIKGGALVVVDEDEAKKLIKASEKPASKELKKKDVEDDDTDEEEENDDEMSHDSGDAKYVLPENVKKMNKTDLQAECDKAGVKYTPEDSKVDLVTKLTKKAK